MLQPLTLVAGVDPDKQLSASVCPHLQAPGLFSPRLQRKFGFKRDIPTDFFVFLSVVTVTHVR